MAVPVPPPVTGTPTVGVAAAFVGVDTAEDGLEVGVWITAVGMDLVAGTAVARGAHAPSIMASANDALKRILVLILSLLLGPEIGILHRF